MHRIPCTSPARTLVDLAGVVAFERDRWRDRELLRAGYSCLRVTSLQAEREAEQIAATVATRLSA
jgi:very-short-patch-repair endonuclease